MIENEMSGDTLLDQVRRRAYDIWLSEGCPHGRDRIHWIRAEAEFREKLTRHSNKHGLHFERRSAGALGSERAIQAKAQQRLSPKGRLDSEHGQPRANVG